jgi:hypothetical protein
MIWGCVTVKTLAVCYSKTGTTKIVADAVVKKLSCDLDELQFDEKTQTMQSSLNPADYDRVIILAPVWAFMLATPMKLYLKKYGKDIKAYALVVTCGMFGLRGCVSNCKKTIGKPPEYAVKLKDKAVRRGEYAIDAL